MGKSKVGSSETMPLDSIPDLGKVLEYFFKSPFEQERRIFNDDVLRPDLPDDTGHLFPEAAFFAVDTFCMAVCDGYVLTGEAAADDVCIRRVF
jgi:hypothetical protein